MSERVPVWPAEAIWDRDESLGAEARSIAPRANYFRASDGYELATLRWPAKGGKARARVILLHGVQSHAGWYHALGRRLAAAGYEAIFPDRRGSGANQTARGHAASAARLLDDVIEICRAERQDSVATALGGISWGGKLAVVAAARAPEVVDALVLLCPGLHPRVKVSTREKLAVAGGLLSGRAAKVRIPIPLSDPALFTDNATAQQFIARDPLSLRDATAGLMFASRVIDRWVARAAKRITQPTLLMLAEHDRVVNNERTQAYFEAIGSARKQLVVLDGAHHTPEFGSDSAAYARLLAEWLAANVGKES